MIGRIAAHERAAPKAHDRVADELIDDHVELDEFADQAIHGRFKVRREAVGIVGQALARLGEADEIHEDDRRRHPALLGVRVRIDQEPFGHLLGQRQVEQATELGLRDVELMVSDNVHKKEH